MRDARRHELFISRLEWFEMGSVSDDFYCWRNVRLVGHTFAQLAPIGGGIGCLLLLLCGGRNEQTVVLEGYNGWIDRQYLLISVLVYPLVSRH
jgi:hypothetical protein